jgi:hypothetical protein
VFPIPGLFDNGIENKLNCRFVLGSSQPDYTISEKRSYVFDLQPKDCLLYVIYNNDIETKGDNHCCQETEAKGDNFAVILPIWMGGTRLLPGWISNCTTVVRIVRAAGRRVLHHPDPSTTTPVLLVC